MVILCFTILCYTFVPLHLLPLLHHIHNTNLTFQWRNPGRNELFSPRFFFLRFSSLFFATRTNRDTSSSSRKKLLLYVSQFVCAEEPSSFLLLLRFREDLFICLCHSRKHEMFAMTMSPFKWLPIFHERKKKDDKEEASSCLLFLCSIKNYLKFSSSWKFSCFPFTSSFFFFIKNSQHESEQALPQFSFTPLPAAEFPLSESRSEALFHFSFFYQLILFFLFLFNQSPDTDDWIVFSVRQHFPYWHPRPGKLFLCVAAHFSRPKKAQKIIVVIQK